MGKASVSYPETREDDFNPLRRFGCCEDDHALGKFSSWGFSGGLITPKRVAMLSSGVTSKRDCV